MSHNNRSIYLEHTIASIEKKQRFSIENADKTNLYSNDEFVEFMVWFDDLSRLVQENPPGGYVRKIMVTENKSGNIMTIEYELFNENERLCDSEIVIVY